ncbi:hypothetical protein K431DRAFT_296058 [Polychaeton citri CBS 116435]|uniref:REJ domain-containing protein n=1 Tax=Polychaeton citri CBS 116435 TaxID=1314669 RepID=A0A9P4Q2P4_9PEZI|nr:hypothetical protein K431DRAFT_296058 [Polychaeton citri CBS 116435]
MTRRRHFREFVRLLLLLWHVASHQVSAKKPPQACPATITVPIAETVKLPTTPSSTNDASLFSNNVVSSGSENSNHTVTSTIKITTVIPRTDLAVRGEPSSLGPILERGTEVNTTSSKLVHSNVRVVQISYKWAASSKSNTYPGQVTVKQHVATTASIESDMESTQATSTSTPLASSLTDPVCTTTPITNTSTSTTSVITASTSERKSSASGSVLIGTLHGSNVLTVFSNSPSTASLGTSDRLQSTMQMLTGTTSESSDTATPTLAQLPSSQATSVSTRQFSTTTRHSTSNLESRTVTSPSSSQGIVSQATSVIFLGLQTFNTSAEPSFSLLPTTSFKTSSKSKVQSTSNGQPSPQISSKLFSKAQGSAQLLSPSQSTFWSTSISSRP